MCLNVVSLIKLESTYDYEYHTGQIFSLLYFKAKFRTGKAYHYLTVAMDFRDG